MTEYQHERTLFNPDNDFNRVYTKADKLRFERMGGSEIWVAFYLDTEKEGKGPSEYSFDISAKSDGIEVHCRTEYRSDVEKSEFRPDTPSYDDIPDKEDLMNGENYYEYIPYSSDVDRMEKVGYGRLARIDANTVWIGGLDSRYTDYQLFFEKGDKELEYGYRLDLTIVRCQLPNDLI